MEPSLKDVIVNGTYVVEQARKSEGFVILV